MAYGRWLVRVAAGAGCVFFASGVGAQQPPAGQTGERTITVSVQYNFQVPVVGEDLTAQNAALESARKWLYQIAVKECQLMTSTFASTFRLEQLNMTNSVHRQMPLANMGQVGANVSYRVGVKPSEK